MILFLTKNFGKKIFRQVECYVPHCTKIYMYIFHQKVRFLNKISMFARKSKFRSSSEIWRKIELFFSKIKLFGQNSNFLVNNRNVGQKNVGQNRNFGQNSKFWSKLEILVKTRNFGQKPTSYDKL